MQKRYNDRINSLPKDFTEDQIIDRCISAGLDRDWGKQIFNIWIQIYNNGEAIRLKRPLLNIYNDAQIALSALKEKADDMKLQLQSMKMIQNYLTEMLQQNNYWN